MIEVLFKMQNRAKNSAGPLLPGKKKKKKIRGRKKNEKFIAIYNFLACWRMKEMGPLNADFSL